MKTPKTKIDFAVGGQAVIEGVMMRSPNFYTVSVRNEAGEIRSKRDSFESITKRIKLLSLPLIRGVVHFIESMKIGFRSLDFSNTVYLGEEGKEKEPKRPVLEFFWKVFGVFYVLGTVAFTIFLLKALPLWIAGKASQAWPFVEDHYLLFNAIDGATKMIIFIGYILLISLIKDIRRTFEYHGAEHKSIWAYEKGLELTVANARKQTRFHPRCGNSFLMLVIFMSILIYTVIPPAESFTLMLLQRVLVVPLIAGVSFETLILSGKYQNKTWIQPILFPGLLVQRLTTREPDDQQLEIALHSLKSALEAEQALLVP